MLICADRYLILRGKVFYYNHHNLLSMLKQNNLMAIIWKTEFRNPVKPTHLGQQKSSKETLEIILSSVPCKIISLFLSGNSITLYLNNHVILSLSQLLFVLIANPCLHWNISITSTKNRDTLFTFLILLGKFRKKVHNSIGKKMWRQRTLKSAALIISWDYLKYVSNKEELNYIQVRQLQQPNLPRDMFCIA